MISMKKSIGVFYSLLVPLFSIDIYFFLFQNAGTICCYKKMYLNEPTSESGLLISCNTLICSRDIFRVACRGEINFTQNYSHPKSCSNLFAKLNHFQIIKKMHYLSYPGLSKQLNGLVTKQSTMLKMCCKWKIVPTISTL